MSKDAILCCTLAVLGCSRATPTFQTPQGLAAGRSGFRVGLTTFAFFDATRQRPRPTRHWYPAAAEAVERDIVLEGIFQGRAAVGAPVANTFLSR